MKMNAANAIDAVDKDKDDDSNYDDFVRAVKSAVEFAANHVDVDVDDVALNAVFDTIRNPLTTLIANLARTVGASPKNVMKGLAWEIDNVVKRDEFATLVKKLLLGEDEIDEKPGEDENDGPFGPQYEKEDAAEELPLPEVVEDEVEDNGGDGGKGGVTLRNVSRGRVRNESNEEELNAIKEMLEKFGTELRRVEKNRNPGPPTYVVDVESRISFTPKYTKGRKEKDEG